MILRAKFVVPVVSPVIENGYIEIAGSRIVAMGRVGGRSITADADFGDAAILPGLVNAHTHLELSFLAGRVPPGPDFTDWLGRLVELRRGEPPEQPAASAVEGARQSIAAGVTCIGDITSCPALTRPALRAAGVRVVSFGEVIAIGARRDALEERLAAALDASYDNDRLSAAVSPHSPYALDPAGLALCAARARDAGRRICIHFAETPEEEAFTLRHEGPLRRHLERLGAWDASMTCPGIRPIELLQRCGLLGPSTLLAHANYVTDDDIRILAATGCHVADCPRTHAAFGHAPHRFRNMLAAGVNVCIGTDSLASNPSLSVLDELRHVHAQYPDVAPTTLLEMATTRGAAALGLSEAAGGIAVGRPADLVVISSEAGDADAALPLIANGWVVATSVSGVVHMK